MRPEELAKTLDLTVLRDKATVADIEAACEIAREHHFAAVTARAGFTEEVRRHLVGSDVKTCASVGLPHGGGESGERLGDVREAVGAGVEELDLVMNTDAMRTGLFREARDELHTMIRSARARALGLGRGDLMVKIIVDAGLLDEKRTRLACKIITDVEGDFAITGSPAAAPRLRDVELLRECLPGHIGVGCGGVADLDQAEEVIAAGASRVCSEVAQEILKTFVERRNA
jgi:deoxyribose-phosphate aldolase